MREETQAIAWRAQVNPAMIEFAFVHNYASTARNWYEVMIGTGSSHARRGTFRILAGSPTARCARCSFLRRPLGVIRRFRRCMFFRWCCGRRYR